MGLCTKEAPQAVLHSSLLLPPLLIFFHYLEKQKYTNKGPQ